MKKQSMKFIIKETGINFYTWCLIGDGFWTPLVKKYCGGSLKVSIMNIVKDNGFWAPDIKNWHELGKNVVNKLEKKQLPVGEIMKGSLESGNKIFELCNWLDGINIAKVPNKQFASWFKKIWSEYLTLSGLGFIPVISDFEHFLLTQKLTNILQSKKTEQVEVQNYLSVLSSFTEPTLYWKEKCDLLAICAKLKNINKISVSEELAEHIQKYFWLNYGYQGPIWAKKDFLHRIKGFFQRDISVSAQYIEHRSGFDNLKKEQARIEEKLKLNSNEKRFFAATRAFMFLKAYRTEVRHRFYYISDQIFKELAKRATLPITVFHYATRGEILKIISGHRVDYRKIIARRDLMAFVTKKGKSRFVPKNKIAKFLEGVLITEVVDQGGMISGQVAFSGKVQGVVRIIESVADIKKMQTGDILVSIATNPDILPAMTKAGAFVTDVGGITSHAAIVAREMKKPCIIGTKIASKVLKDGDLIELDTKKGDIRKI